MNPDISDNPDNPGGVNNPLRNKDHRRIKQALDEVLESDVAVYDETPGKCLRVLRQVVSRAHGMSHEDFYARFRQFPVDDNPDPAVNMWARDVMRSLREMGLRVADDGSGGLVYRELEAGDLLFSWALGSPEGHCAVLLTGGPNALAYENTGQERGVRVSGYNRLSRVDELTLLFPGSWEAFRLPDELPPPAVTLPDVPVPPPPLPTSPLLTTPTLTPISPKLPISPDGIKKL